MKNLILLIVFIFVAQSAFAQEIPVRIKPLKKITTSNIDLKEGDEVDFVIVEDVLINSKTHIKAGEPVTGIITTIEENNILAKPAKLYIENIKTKNIDGQRVNLKGLVYKSGNDHNEIMEFLNPEIVRGGEVQILPKKDEFIVYISQVVTEKTPVKITPAELISTVHDGVELGDWLEFKIVSDVYKNDKLYIKKQTPIFGLVDSFHPNGWVTDNAEIKFDQFRTKDLNGNKITINYPLKIDGNAMRDDNIKRHYLKVLLTVIRGYELNIKPNQKVFNIFITQ